MAKNVALFIGQLLDVFEPVFTLLNASEKGTFLEGVAVVLQSFGINEGIGILQDLLVGHTRKGIS